jgi:hypothetical protein
MFKILFADIFRFLLLLLLLVEFLASLNTKCSEVTREYDPIISASIQQISKHVSLQELALVFVKLI